MTHDVNTMVGFAYERVVRGERMAGLVAIPDMLDIGPAIEDLVVLIECSADDEWEGRVHFLPL